MLQPFDTPPYMPKTLAAILRHLFEHNTPLGIRDYVKRCCAEYKKARMSDNWEVHCKMFTQEDFWGFGRCCQFTSLLHLSYGEQANKIFTLKRSNRHNHIAALYFEIKFPLSLCVKWCIISCTKFTVDVHGHGIEMLILSNGMWISWASSSNMISGPSKVLMMLSACHLKPRRKKRRAVHENALCSPSSCGGYFTRFPQCG